MALTAFVGNILKKAPKKLAIFILSGRMIVFGTFRREAGKYP